MQSTATAASAGKVEFIQVPNTLRQKLGARFNGVDAATLAKAEEALKSLSTQFGAWLNDELEKLEAARAEVRRNGPQGPAMDRLYLCAHDLKGLGATYEYPLITRIAGSLCRMIDDKEKRATVPLELVDAHIDAIKAAVRDEIKSDEHPVGRVLVEELERRVKAMAA